MLPPVTDHVTAVFEVPETVALNCTVPPAATVDVDGVNDKDTVAAGAPEDGTNTTSRK